MIGKGSFGRIYYAKEIETEEEVAIKMEIDDNKHKTCYLLREAKILFDLKGAVGFNLILIKNNEKRIS